MNQPNLDSSLNAINLKQLKVVLYRNKYFPEEYVHKRTKLLNQILQQEKERLNIKDPILKSDDEEQIADRVRQELLDSERKRIFYYNERPKMIKMTVTQRHGIKKSKKVPFVKLQKHKLVEMFHILEKDKELNTKQKQLRVCLSSMYPQGRNMWNSPCFLLKAIKECLLTRNWNTLTYLLQELIHLPDLKYKPYIKDMYKIMDKLHPVIHENDLQGEYLNIRSYHTKILNNTNIV